MAFNYEYPYTDPHRHNSDYILRVAGDAEKTIETLRDALKTGIKNPEPLYINGVRYDGAERVELTIQGGGGGDGMQRFIVKLVKNGSAYNITDYDGHALSYAQLRSHVQNVNEYVVMLYGNSKLRPQYVGASEMLFIGLDRASVESKILRCVITSSRTSYETFSLAEKSDLTAYALKSEIPSDQHINDLIASYELSINAMVNMIDEVIG